jgi:hypothetical protein
MEPDLAELSVLDPARGREPDSFERLRSDAALDRIIEGPRHRPMMRRTLIGATAAAVGAALVVPSLFPSAADKAFASWTATPTPVTGQQVLPSARTCVSGFGTDRCPEHRSLRRTESCRSRRVAPWATVRASIRTSSVSPAPR